MYAEPTQTAVIIPIEAAEPVVAHHRRHLDRAASWGVPAHVTVLYPFLPPSAVDDDVLSRLRTVFAGTRAFDCTFARCRWFDDAVLWLAPDREKEFRDLTSAVAAEFPDFPPYGGVHDDVIPHLTVGESTAGSVEQLKAAEADVSRRLPVTQRVEHGLLIAGAEQRHSWRTVATLPLGEP